MNWKQKARARSLLASMPGGASIYRFLQRRYGRLRDANPWRRMKWTRELVLAMEGTGVSLANWRLAELGTGWMPVAPIFFWLGGAARIDGFDIERNLDEGTAAKVVRQLACAPEARVKKYLEGLSAVDEGVMSQRLVELAQLRTFDLETVSQRINLIYHAPAKMSAEAVAGEQFDCIYSMGVLEHLTKDELVESLLESRKVLKPGGYLLHGVNCADHSFHDQSMLSTVNFVQYSEIEWQSIAGNRFMFHNRMRAVEYRELLRLNGFEIINFAETVDQDALQLIGDGFPVDETFRRFTPEELATRRTRILARLVE